jgi:D-alanyl-D-alanine endopeptidase (penicillin-binding protein 7)
MTLSTFVAFLAAAALHANPSPNAIPTSLNDAPMRVVERAPIQAPVKIRKDSYGIMTSADEAIVVDVSSGAVLYGKHPNEAHSIASLTKLLSAMVILDTGLHPDDRLWIGDAAIETSASHPFRGGEALKRGDAFKAMLVGSVNEIANAFGDAFPGGRAAFVSAMNEKAKLLDLEHATFVDPSGINPKNVASATDVARIIRSALAYAEIREATSPISFTVQTEAGRSVKLDSTNLLLPSYLNKDPYHIVLGKTGSLPEAGFCFGQVTANAAGNQVMTIVLGSKEHFARFQEVKGLTAWAFDTYKW